MPPPLSPRLLSIVDTLPLRPGLRVLEIGCGPGAAARERARRLPTRFIPGIDRAATAIARAEAAAIAAGLTENLAFRLAAMEAFTLAPGEAPFDLAVAVRVGARDDRHVAVAPQALAHIAAALTPTGRLFIDGGAPLREITLPGRELLPPSQSPSAGGRPPISERSRTADRSRSSGR